MAFEKITYEKFDTLGHEQVNAIQDAILDAATNEELNSHIDNQNNPHNVTAEQIGAVPVATSFTMAGDRVKRIQTGGKTAETGGATGGGITIGQTYYDLDNPESGIGTLRGRMGSQGIFVGCDYSNSEDIAAGKELGFRIKAENPYAKQPSAVFVDAQDGSFKYYRAKENRVYAKDELVEMDEFDVLHTGNAESLGYGKIYRGTYTGTGTYGDSNPTTLAFNFVPKLLMVSSKVQLTQYDEIFVNCGALTTSWQYIHQNSSTGSYSRYTKIKKSADGKTIYISGFHEVADPNTGNMATSASGSAIMQCNESGTTYHVTAW